MTHPHTAETVHDESGGHAPAPNKAAILTIIIVSYVMIILDISVVMTGLPKIQHQLGFSEVDLAWVQTAYTLTFGGFLLVGARAGDILGRRHMLIAGLAIFTLASVAIGASFSAPWMLAWRAIQGLGSAILAPSVLALLQTNFAEGEERTKAVSYYAAAAGLSATMGLIVGGILVQWVSWRAGFYINLPIGIVLIIGASYYISETDRLPGKLDIAGGLTSTLGVAGLVYGFIRSAETGWHDDLTQMMIGFAAALIALFILIERNAAQPVLPLGLFASRVRSGAYAARFLYMGAMIGFWFFTSLYLQDVAGYSAGMAGLAFVPATIPHVPLSILFPYLARRFRPQNLLVFGLCVGIIGMAWLSRASVAGGYLLSVALPMLLIGISQGLSLIPLTSAGISGVAGKDAGAASGAVNVAHQTGHSVGLSILVAVAGSVAATLSGRELMAVRIMTALEGASAMLFLALLIVLATIFRPRARA
ncbi:MAG TPA: MFS transporter [Sphingobium sp.]